MARKIELKVQIPLTADEKEVVRVADALRELKLCRGWDILQQLLEERQRHIGLLALDDEKFTKDYWRGRRDELAELLTGMDVAIENGDQVLSEQDSAPSGYDGLTMGVGSVSVG